MRETTFPYFTKVPKITNSVIKITIFPHDWTGQKSQESGQNENCPVYETGHFSLANQKKMRN